MTDELRTQCCETVIRWPGDGETLTCSCGLLSWTQRGPDVGPTGLEFKGSITSYPAGLAEELWGTGSTST